MFFYIILLLTAQILELQKQLSDTSKSNQQQKQLVGQLEKDILSVNALSTLYRGEGEVCISK